MFLDCISKAIFLFVIYNTVVLLLFGVPKSLSMTYYLFKERSNILKVLFPAMTSLLGVFLMPCWIEISEGSNWQFLSFLSVLSLFAMTIITAFKDLEPDNKIHNICPYCFITFSMLWIILVTPYWYVILIIFVITTVLAIVTKTVKNGYIYWLEMIAFVSSFIAIVAYYVNFIK